MPRHPIVGPRQTSIRTAFAAAALCVAGLVLPAGTAVAAPVLAASAAYAWGGHETLPPNRTTGTTRYAGGVFSYTDRWGDGQGANSDGLHREDYFGSVPGEGAEATYDLFGTHRLAHNGDYLLPQDDARFPELSADVLFAQLRPAADGGLDGRVVLNALGAKDSAIVTLGLDTDGVTTASTPFPRNAALGCSPCGIDRFVSVWGTGGDVADASGASLGAPTDVTASTEEDQLTFHVPGSLLGRTGDNLHAWLAVGVHDAAGKFQTVAPVQTSTNPGGGTGGTNVFDLAFVQEDRARVDDKVQADLLQAQNAAPARATVDLAALAAGATRVEGEPTGGPVERLLVSRLKLGEGIDNGTTPAGYQTPEPASVYHYLGRVQPYLVYLPAGYSAAAAHSLVMFLHGYNGSYDEGYFLAGATFNKALDDHGMLAVFPLGRGDIQYEADSELDLLEVLADVDHSYAVDPTQHHLAGLSMGGYGTSKLGTRHPDAFADVTPFLGVAQSDGLPNLVNSPYFSVTANGDFDAGGIAATQYYSAVRDLGYESHLKNYTNQSHSFRALQDATDELFAFWGRHRTPSHPARVVFVQDAAWSQPALGLHDDSAYWASGMTLRGGATTGRLDTEAFTVPRALTTQHETTTTGGQLADLTAFTRTDAIPVVTGQRALANGLSVAVTGLSSSTLDLTGLGVDPSQRYCLDLTADAPTTVQLRQPGWSGATLAGVTGSLDANGGTLAVPAGHTLAVVAPPGTTAQVGTPCPLRSATTGTTGTTGATSASATGAGAVAPAQRHAAASRVKPRGPAAAHRRVAASQPTRTLAFTGTGPGLPVAALALLLAAAVVRRQRRHHLRGGR